jgi:hypothetical protein
LLLTFLVLISKTERKLHFLSCREIDVRLSELGRSKVGGKTTGESQEVGQRRVEDPIRWMDDVFKQAVQTTSNIKQQQAIDWFKEGAITNCYLLLLTLK